MLTKFTPRTKKKSTAIVKKASRLLFPPSLGLEVTIVIVIAAIYGLLLIALITVATAYADSNQPSISDPLELVRGR